MTWRPTHAQVRVVCVAAGLLVVAVVARRPDLAVLGMPLAFVAVWGRFFRPRTVPQVATELDADVLFEGQATTYRVLVPGTVDPDIDLVVAAVPRTQWFRYDPPQAAVAESAADGTVSVEVGVRSERWGLRRLERPQVIATSDLGSYRVQLPDAAGAERHHAAVAGGLRGC